MTKIADYDLVDRRLVKHKAYLAPSDAVAKPRLVKKDISNYRKINKLMEETDAVEAYAPKIKVKLPEHVLIPNQYRLAYEFTLKDGSTKAAIIDQREPLVPQITHYMTKYEAVKARQWGVVDV